jgi:hypothetical protein
MRSLCILTLAASLLAGLPARASVIVETFGATLLDVGTQFEAPAPFNQFNPSLGVLKSLTLQLTGSLAGTVGIENTSNQPDVAKGIIGGSVFITSSDGVISITVNPAAIGPIHNLGPFDGVVDFAGSSGATDSVSSAPLTASQTVNRSSELAAFSGTGQVFLTLGATSFPVVEGQQTEAATETANATGALTLTYDYVPRAVPAPSGLPLLALSAVVLGVAQRRLRRN